MLRISLEQWRMFIMVAEHGGFNQAAQAIYKSQSSIHNAVQKIEHSLGVKLFRVEGRKTLLTDAGELVLRRANYLLQEAARVEQVGHTLAEGIESRLRIAVDEIFPHPLLYKALENTSQQYPLLRIELMESILTGAKELLENAEADIAVSPVVQKELFNEELCQIEFVAVACPQHPLLQLGRELNLEDLKSYRQIVVRDSAHHNRHDEGWLGANQRWTVSHMRTSIDMIKQGLGFAWLPLTSILEDLTQGRLQRLPLCSGASRKVSLYLLFSDADKLGPAARTFLGELRYQSIDLPTSADL
ncbi:MULTISPECIES: LysR family transcriptional regulator [Rheinheimera]|jgi:DNA-binding transcriptional LysR family regulator|uniref:LysR family transcriptional regulator n=1 Tax=Rheinheimera aquimaris TaxID=412437 RepID=A0ABN1E875_9GAMM|nr:MULTISPECIES: LysR family transcriptional regulator [Rheinheimera]MCB5215138.1 LysR family transcriptional regulator [Rheinheimera aquimaris]MCD1600018.1 LysR family transcriptional regulator [Rheinheimera aquimaris]HBN90169.1 LysR family transcriptional regulator [Rheinheimera sp.]|tara:strand:- start:858 stop:1760 length:903 start_codon:yes stop_codon:yes gene_type:complete